MEFAAPGSVRAQSGDHLGLGPLCCYREVSHKANRGGNDHQSISGQQGNECSAFFKKLNSF